MNGARHPFRKNNNFDFYFIPQIKINSRQVANFNMRGKTITLEENRGENLCELEIDKKPSKTGHPK